MPRRARNKSASGIYHIMLQGINRQSIFEDDEDKEKFLQTLRECKEISKYKLDGVSLRQISRITGFTVNKIYKS